MGMKSENKETCREIKGGLIMVMHACVYACMCVCVCGGGWVMQTQRADMNGRVL